MKIFYDPIQKSHVPAQEIISGKVVKHHEKRARIDVIIRELRARGGFTFEIPPPIPMEAILAVHDDDYVKFLEASQHSAKEEIIWPYVFPCDQRLPVRNPVTPLTAGYFCFDVGTPIMRDTWAAATAAASGAYAAARHTRKTGEIAYALARPPGHHASQNKFGGYCYLNNAAIAAHYLSQYGKVLLVDFDFHHGNGTQSIFYDSSDVFYMSLHCDPHVEYPYFTGYEDETGIDDGAGYNLNLPLPNFCGAQTYFAAFHRGLEKVFQTMDPEYVVVSAGFDIAEGDPIGHFHITFDDFAKLGKLIQGLNKKTVIIQEGGYYVENLGRNVEAFLSALI